MLLYERCGDFSTLHRLAMGISNGSVEFDTNEIRHSRNRFGGVMNLLETMVYLLV